MFGGYEEAGNISLVDELLVAELFNCSLYDLIWCVVLAVWHC